MGTVRGLLFDLDGTLVSTKKANFLSYRDAFAEFGYEMTAEIFEGTWGQDSRRFIPELLPGIPAEQVEAIRARKSLLYEGYLDQTFPNVPLIEFIKLVQSTHSTAIVSTAKTVNGLQIVRCHGLEELFDVLVFGDAVTHGKPDPECYCMACEQMGIEPGEGVAFEDSDTGAQSALAAGLQVIRVPEFE